MSLTGEKYFPREENRTASRENNGEMVCRGCQAVSVEALVAYETLHLTGDCLFVFIF